MYKNDRENLKKDNLKLRKAMQDLVNQNFMLKKQVSILEQEDISQDPKSDAIREQLEYEVERLKKELNNEIGKNNKWENFSNELKIGKQKSEMESKNVKEELQKLRNQVKELNNKNSFLVKEKDQSKNKLLQYQEEINNLRASQLSQPLPEHQQLKISKGKKNQSNEDFVKITNEETYNSQIQEEVKEPDKSQNFKQEIVQTSEIKKFNKKKETPKIAADLFKNNEGDIGSHQFESQLEPPKVRKNKLTSYPVPSVESTMNQELNHIQRNTSHGIEKVDSNIVTSAEDFFSNLSEISTQNMQKPISGDATGSGTQLPKQFEQQKIISQQQNKNTHSTQQQPIHEKKFLHHKNLEIQPPMDPIQQIPQNYSTNPDPNHDSE